MQNILIGHLTCLDHLCEQDFYHTNRKFAFDRFFRTCDNMQIMVTGTNSGFSTFIITFQHNSVFSCTTIAGVWLIVRVHQFSRLLPLGRVIGIICLLFYYTDICINLHNIKLCKIFLKSIFGNKFEIWGCPWVDTFQSSGLKLKNDYLLSVLFVCVKMLLHCMQNTADNAGLQAAQCCILECPI